MSAATATKERTPATAAPAPTPGMRITVNRGELLRALGHATAIVEKRNTIPVLSNVLLEAAGEELRITTTDLNLQIALTVPCQVEAGGATTVPAGLLHGIIREFPDGAQVELALVDGRLNVNSGRSRYKLQTLPGDQFPALLVAETRCAFRLAAPDLLRTFARIAFAQSIEVTTRHYLCGIFVSSTGADLAFAATDGNRLAEAKLPRPDDLDLPDIILPSKLVDRLSKLIEEEDSEIGLTVTNTMLKIDVGTTVLTGKLIDGTYPDYRRVIPTMNDKVLQIEVGSFAGAVRRASIIASERTRAVKIELSEDKLTASCSSPEHGTSVEEAPCAWSSGDFSTGANARYLLDLLGATGADSLEVAFADGASPILFTNPADDSAKWVVMPMRV